MKPAFWTDVRIAELPAPCRLFYIGLWMQADDAGWLRWDVPQIAAELYGFESRTRRERNVIAYGDALEATNRIERLPCGHAFISKMAGHQRLSGSTKQVLSIAREHERVCVTPRTSPQVPADTRESPPGKERERVMERVNRNGKGTERLGTGSAGARASSDAAPADSEFQRLVPRDEALGLRAVK